MRLKDPSQILRTETFLRICIGQQVVILEFNEYHLVRHQTLATSHPPQPPPLPHPTTTAKVREFDDVTGCIC